MLERSGPSGSPASPSDAGRQVASTYLAMLPLSMVLGSLGMEPEDQPFGDLFSSPDSPSVPHKLFGSRHGHGDQVLVASSCNTLSHLLLSWYLCPSCTSASSLVPPPPLS